MLTITSTACLSHPFEIVSDEPRLAPIEIRVTEDHIRRGWPQITSNTDCIVGLAIREAAPWLDGVCVSVMSGHCYYRSNRTHHFRLPPAASQLISFAIKMPDLGWIGRNLLPWLRPKPCSFVLRLPAPISRGMGRPDEEGDE